MRHTMPMMHSLAHAPPHRRSIGHYSRQQWWLRQLSSTLRERQLSTIAEVSERTATCAAGRLRPRTDDPRREAAFAREEACWRVWRPASGSGARCLPTNLLSRPGADSDGRCDVRESSAPHARSAGGWDRDATGSTGRDERDAETE